MLHAAAVSVPLWDRVAAAAQKTATFLVPGHSKIMVNAIAGKGFARLFVRNREKPSAPLRVLQASSAGPKKMSVRMAIAKLSVAAAGGAIIGGGAVHTAEPQTSVTRYKSDDQEAGSGGELIDIKTDGPIAYREIPHREREQRRMPPHHRARMLPRKRKSTSWRACHWLCRRFPARQCAAAAVASR